MLKVIGLLLAAGHSRRFGSDKRRHRLPDGRTLLQASAERIGSVCDELRIAVRANEAQGASLLDTLSTQPNWLLQPVSDTNAGMGDSLADLAQSLLDEAGKNGLDHPASDTVYLVALGDMPYVQQSTLRMLIQTHRQNALLAQASLNPDERTGTTLAVLPASIPLITAPIYQGRRGHPVLFSASLLNELARCVGDEGAKHVVQQHAASLCSVPVDDIGVTQDVDAAPMVTRPFTPG